MDLKIIDDDGEWIKTGGEFPLHHPLRNVHFRPDQMLKIRIDPWIIGQPVLNAVVSLEDLTAKPKVDPNAKAEPEAAKGAGKTPEKEPAK